MSEPNAYTYPRYLKAKKSVDERALNRRVWPQFLELLSENTTTVQILEVGGGVGATFQRVANALADKGLLSLDYTIVDREPSNIQAAKQQVQSWARNHGYSIHTTEDQIRLSRPPFEVNLRVMTNDLFAYADQSPERHYNAVIAQAVLDLLELEKFFSSTRVLLENGGLWYLPIHFDGVTAFEPTIDREFDDRVERLYHQSMTDENDGSGSRAHTGRRLLSVLSKGREELIAAGSSDWIVFARDGQYENEEEYFLHHILHFIDDELSNHPGVDNAFFRQWIDKRRAQITSGELIYIAHQLDVLAQKNE